MSVPSTDGVRRPRAQRRKASSVNIVRLSVPSNAAEAVHVTQVEPSARKAGARRIRAGRGRR
jgi:hypothetical protein